MSPAPLMAGLTVSFQFHILQVSLKFDWFGFNYIIFCNAIGTNFYWVFSGIALNTMEKKKNGIKRRV